MNEFVTGASQIGAGIGGFLNPIIGGTSTTTTTTAPTVNTSSSKNIGIWVVGILVIGVAIYLLNRNN